MDLSFTKAEGAGNDFIIVDSKVLSQSADINELARSLCQRKKGIGADGLLVFDTSDTSDFKMRIFNPDGSEVDMCGNGIRCLALYAVKKKDIKNTMAIETGAGVIEASVNNGIAKIKLTDPKDIRLNVDLTLTEGQLLVHCINTGVPHAIHFVDDFSRIDVAACGAEIRRHKDFLPKGTNADFVKIIDESNIEVRTFERGVEKETLACGTGAVASAIVAALLKKTTPPVNVYTASSEVLKIYFEIADKKCHNVYLEGSCKLVFEGKVSIP